MQIQSAPWSWAGSLFLISCATNPAPQRPPPPVEGHPRAAPPVESSEPEAATAAPTPPPEIPDGCTSDVDPDSDAEPLLEQVAESCLEDMHPIAPEPLLVNLAPGALKDLPFTIMDPSKCVRAVATGAKEVREIDLTIVDRSDHVLGQDKLPGSIALANLDGPVCFKDPGQYRAVVRMVDGSGSVAIQVWQAE